MMSATIPSPTTLASLVSSRLCHDLISPIGAIGNGLELLESTAPPSPELDLIQESADTASAKLRFFRVAFGAASPTEVVEAKTLGGAISGMFALGRLSVTWEAQALPRRHARLLLLLLLCAESALPLGGTVNAQITGETIHLIGEGRRTRFEDGPWAHLTAGTDFPDCSSALVHFLLARQFAQDIGHAVTLSPAEGGFVLVSAPAG